MGLIQANSHSARDHADGARPPPARPRRRSRRRRRRRRSRRPPRPAAPAAESQLSCVNFSILEGAKTAGVALAASLVAILGAARLSPSFNRSLSVSAKTALIVTPPFGAFFLSSELAMGECARRRYDAQRALKAAAADAAAAARQAA